MTTPGNRRFTLTMENKAGRQIVLTVQSHVDPVMLLDLGQTLHRVGEQAFKETEK